MATTRKIFRPARREDFDGILAIGDVLFGLDYMPYSLHQYLEDPDYYCYVAEVDGKVVSVNYYNPVSLIKKN